MGVLHRFFVALQGFEDSGQPRVAVPQTPSKPRQVGILMREPLPNFDGFPKFRHRLTQPTAFPEDIG